MNAYGIRVQEPISIGLNLKMKLWSKPFKKEFALASTVGVDTPPNKKKPFITFIGFGWVNSNKKRPGC